MKKDKLHIGTISWKYDSWQGIVYPENKLFNHLLEYSRHYSTVEVDQWFWSLFSGDKAALPKIPVVEEYVGSVSGDFSFGIKIPNSITLTHHYKKKKSDPLTPKRREVETFVYVKNGFEGSAPMTIGRIENRLKSQ
ncbi:MAG: DUF72 domain-containing protein [Desulforhopalus sp.]